VPTGVLDLGVHELDAGKHKLTIEITGANDKAVKAYMAGLDFVRLEKQ
jgi:VCBS repeat-containing protein